MSTKLLLSLALSTLLLSDSLLAKDSIDADLGGFDTEEISDTEGDDLSGFGDDEMGSDLDGFGDETQIADEIEVVTLEANKLSVTGNVAFKTAYGIRDHVVYADKTAPSPTYPTGELIDPVDYSGFNQAQTSAYLQVDYKLSSDWKVRVSGDAFYDAIYDIRTENNYNQATLDAYKTQLRFDDVYVQGRLSKDIDLKVGRQIVVWGKSDSIRITDVINPLDNRLPGMTDIKDLRLSTTMAKFDYYLGDWNFSAMAIVESRIFLEAAPRSEYFPVDSIFPVAPSPFIELVQPENSWDNMQYALAANGIFSGWDLSFYGADVFDSKWYIDPDTRKREVSKIQMLGSAINIVKGSFLLKSEMAFINGIKYNSTTDAKQRLDALVGVDYMGVKDTVLSLEVANRHIFDYEAQMGGVSLKPDYVQEDEMQTAMRVTRSFENDSINATILLSMSGHNWEYGGFFRASLEYDVVDAVVANVGVINYLSAAKPEDKPFVDAISNNDKIFADITYSF